MSKTMIYRIYPKPYPGKEIQESALVDMAGVIRVILGDSFIDVKILKNGIELMAEASAMTELLEKSTILKSCSVEFEEVTIQ